jgi:hypothetical protein
MNTSLRGMKSERAIIPPTDLRWKNGEFVSSPNPQFIDRCEYTRPVNFFETKPSDSLMQNRVVPRAGSLRNMLNQKFMIDRVGEEKGKQRLTSQGGGALLYDGTILNVTEPLASLWKGKLTRQLLLMRLSLDYHVSIRRVLL